MSWIALVSCCRRSLARAQGASLRAGFVVALAGSGCTVERAGVLDVVALPGTLGNSVKHVRGSDLVNILGSSILLDFKESEGVKLLAYTSCIDDAAEEVEASCRIAMQGDLVTIHTKLIYTYERDARQGGSCGDGVVVDCGSLAPGAAAFTIQYEESVVALQVPSVRSPDEVTLPGHWAW